MKTYRYSISEELTYEWRDAGPWRSFYLETYGDTLSELFENATIEAIDQDGGALDCFGYDNALNSGLERCIEQAITDGYNKKN